jgi:hypothetical protein
MRLWSIHPCYLDSKGLVALWREGLLAKKVLEGKTKGYRNHPQLIRFRAYEKPLFAINAYLTNVLLEAEKRGYRFDSSKINILRAKSLILVNRGQLSFEFQHLLGKLRKRDLEKYYDIKDTVNLVSNPIFKVIPGKVEEWEKV